MSKTTDERATFSLLWKMVNEIQREGGMGSGTIISRYARVIDDRIENGGYSRSVDSLKLYTTDQLQEEIDEREEGV